MPSIRKNFLYNIGLKVINIIFPLITFPYIARVLAPEGIGKVDFSLSVIQYFIMIAQLGIPTYGVRECAKYKNDKKLLSRTVQEILVINIIMVSIAYLIFGIIVINISELLDYKKLLLIVSINIFSTSIGVEWFYQAIEEYKYITIRSILIKIISLWLIFSFVNDSSDYFVYAIIVVFSISGGYIYNFFHINKHIKLLEKHDKYYFKKHLKPILILFAMSVSVSIYINLDKVMLGLMSGSIAVGLYTAANKMINVILALVTSLGTVLLPRMSYYVEKDAKSETTNLIRKSIDFILMISIPASLGVFLLAEPIIMIFAGTKYTAAVMTIKILSPIIIAIALSNLIGIQILISHGKEKLTFFSTLIGAVINLVLNLLLIPRFQQNGAAISTLIAELCVTVVQIFLAYSLLKNNVAWKRVLQYMIGGMMIAFVVKLSQHFTTSLVSSTIISIFGSVVVYFAYLYMIKNEIVHDTLKRLFSKVKDKSLT